MSDPGVGRSLSELRAAIEVVDAQLIDLVARRMRLVREVGQV